MPDSPSAVPSLESRPAPLAGDEPSWSVAGHALRLTGGGEDPFAPNMTSLLGLRDELVMARALVLEDAGAIRRRLEGSSRVDPIVSITGRDSFDAVAGQIDHQIALIDVEIARHQRTAFEVETVSETARRLLKRD